MLINSFPWLNSRKRTLISYFFEIISFFFIYSIIYKLIFDEPPLYTLYELFFVHIWIFISYLFGRYSIKIIDEKNIIIFFVKTFLVLISTISIFLTFLWVVDVHNITFLLRSFLIPFMLFFSLFSCLIQIIIDFLLKVENKKRNKFTYLGSQKVLDLIKNEINISNLDIELKLINSFNGILKDDFIETCGLIIEDENKFREFFRIKKNDLIDKDFLVLNIFKFCEIYLQRFPTKLIKLSNVMIDDFKVKNTSIHLRIKRISDILVSLILIFTSAPIVAILCFFIKVEDKGPILYKQLRNGFKGRVFSIYKLRTMKVDSEKFGPQWSTNYDMRITRIGKLMRLTRIDELPQLFAVIKGDMSLIGPRPERPKIDLELESKIKFYKNRYTIKPGISGWAQVNYPYGASIRDSKMKLSYDLYYVKNLSLFLDILIFLKTIKVVFTGKGSKPRKND